MIKTTWEYSLETDALRLLHSAHQIAVGFYKINNFHVCPPSSNTSFSNQDVIFPNLNYYKIHRFWEKVKTIDVDTLPVKTTKDLLENTKEILKDGNIDLTPNYEKIKSDWNLAQEEVLTEIERIIPGTLSKITDISIYPTKLGTSASFNAPSSFPTSIIIYLRTDQDIYTITEAILTCLTKNDIYTNFDGLWSESEILVDWLITRSSLAHILSRYQPKTNFIPTLKGIRNIESAKALTKSDIFVASLGASLNTKTFDIEKDAPTVNGKRMENLSSREKEALSLLIKNSNQITNIDSISEILFKDEDDFSLQAVAKFIQRLRQKLEQNGVSSVYIQTLRGQGYLLRN